jgi:hypothetical protein
MRTTPTATVSEPGRPGLPGEALTRRAVTVITAAIVVMTFAFSLGNVTTLCLGLGITAWIAWLVAPAVDLSVVGLLTGMRFLSLHGHTDTQLVKLHRMLRFCGLLTLALNTAGALSHRQYGTALVDAVGPALLIGWSEIGPWMLRQVHAACPPPAPCQPQPAAVRLPVLPPSLLARTRELDAAHRAATGRPISRDTLRAQLRIGRDRASALVTAVRKEARQGTEERALQPAVKPVTQPAARPGQELPPALLWAAGLSMSPSPGNFQLSHDYLTVIYHRDIGSAISPRIASFHVLSRPNLRAHPTLLCADLSGRPGGRPVTSKPPGELKAIQIGRQPRFPRRHSSERESELE